MSKKLIDSKPTILVLTAFDTIGNQGGVSKVVREHEKMFIDSGYNYVMLFPTAKIKTNLLGCCINGRFIGLISENEIKEFITSNLICEIHIHHLLRMNIEAIEGIIRDNDINVKFFVHDFYSICPSISFVNSEGKFCGDDPVSEKKCHGCAFFEEAITHKEKIINFINTLRNRLVVVFPSDYANDVWQKAYGILDVKQMVIPHQMKVGTYNLNKKIKEPIEEIRIAYLGKCNTIKGFESWSSSIKKISNNRYSFFVFSEDQQKSSLWKNIYINVKKNEFDTIEKLRNNHIDVVVLNSILGETYSYTYFESYASNCFVITNQNSGNIARSVKQNGNGIVMDEPDELYSVLNNEEELRILLNKWKAIANGPDFLEPNKEFVRITSQSAISETCKGLILYRSFSVKRLILEFGYRVMRLAKKCNFI